MLKKKDGVTMKMELIGENQIKIELTKEDLIERDIKITELAYGGDKARELFREIMEIANEEYGFDVDNVPIMVEAMPLSLEKISILVTKVTDPDELEEKLKKVPKEQVFKPVDKTFDEIKKKIVDARKETLEKIEEKYKDNNIVIFSFDDLDTCVFVSKRINNNDFSKSALILDNQKYFLTFEMSKNAEQPQIDKLENILYEYGQKHISTMESKFYLLEHGETIIKKDAVEILSSMN